MKKTWKKIHSMLGIVSVLFLSIIGITGAFLSFEKDITEFLNPKVYNINYKNKTAIDKKLLIQKIQKEHNLKVLAIRVYSDPKKAFVLVTPPKEGATSKKKVLYYINPYTGEITTSLNARTFFLVNRYLHKDLMIGIIGKNIVAISTIILIILSLSGLYLYYKPLKYNIKSAMKINFLAKGKRLYYKLHTVFGIYFLLAFLIMSLSGLFWSYEWYKNAIYKLADVQIPKFAHKTGNKKRVYNSLDLNKTMIVLDIFNKNIKDYEVLTIRKIRKSDNFLVSYLKKESAHHKAFNTVTISIEKNKILNHKKYEDKRVGEKVIASMLPIHSGEFFGLFFKIIFLIASASLLMFSITGLLLFKKGRK
ncbi:hypothetical protein CRU96_14230 [Malaciobacter halophilus]|nr:PepSY-associated TM helix domain-containing protein [Malaciobacter halophilus]RYA22224.1 hypothetical protein CRU96_14230 [Malaciobacter halophilus]